MSRLDETLGAVGFDNLINGTYPPAEVYSVEVASGQGVLKRGSVLAIDTLANPLLLIDDSACTGEFPRAILAETVDTGSVPESKVKALAYRTGHFNANSLITGNGYELTAENKEKLRSLGILISDAVEI